MSRNKIITHHTHISALYERRSMNLCSTTSLRHRLLLHRDHPITKVHWPTICPVFSVLTDGYEKIFELERFNKQACDILECRIEANLDDMGLTALCELPEDDPILVEEFLQLTKKICLEAVEQLSKYVTWLVVKCIDNSLLAKQVKFDFVPYIPCCKVSFVLEVHYVTRC